MSDDLEARVERLEALVCYTGMWVWPPEFVKAWKAKESAHAQLFDDMGLTDDALDDMIAEARS